MKEKGKNITGHEIILCDAINGCPLQLLDISIISDKIESFFDSSSWNKFYTEKSGKKHLYHSKIKISISGCPNTCSEPQIRDIGLIAQKRPKLFPDYCKLCGKCEKVCQESAIKIKNGYGPVFNDKCIYCGQCIEACPFGALYDERKGYQILVGGKLGRHPQLAKKYQDFQNDKQVLNIIELATDFIIEKTTDRSIPRLGDLISDDIFDLWKRKSKI